MKPHLSLTQIFNMNAGFLGIQFGWGLQLANMSAIYSKLGANPDAIPLLWLAGPVTGLLIQPIIGALSDRTWCRLGRRRPYFLIGAILASLALFVMPDSPTLMFAAAMLWILDASVNVSMEPFRAFVADKLNSEQRTLGFVMQSFLIGIGATLANALPLIFHNAGMTGVASNGVPLTVIYSFKIGALVYLLTVLWTVCTSIEYPPETAGAGANSGAATTALEALKEIPAELVNAARQMPPVMRQLAPVQILTWLGLFCMWMFFGLATAYHVFKAPGPHSASFDRATEWAGWCFAIYSIVCFVVAFPLRRFADKYGARLVHAAALGLGGASLISVFFIQDAQLLQLPMIGIGIAWASILALPYSILSSALPVNKIGLYMGLFNFFIVIPEIVASLTFQPLVKNVFGNNPIYVLVMGGVSLIFAGVLMLRVREIKSSVEEVTTPADTATREMVGASR